MVSARSTGPVDFNAELKARFPYIVTWPREISNDFSTHVCAQYFSGTCVTNWFDCCILIHKADNPQDALMALKDEFATKLGRDTLLKIISEARNSPWCKGEVLDCVERYATYAFVLDGTRVTFGALPV